MLYYLHTDHLGSASLTTDASGNIHAQQRYFPYGETRWSSAPLPTDRQFTGQRREAALGIYDYKARFYSPRLSRFLSADTVVPGVGSQHLSKYMYVTGNPLRYDDPTGHYTSEEIKKYLQDNYEDWQSYWDAWQADPYWMWVLAEAKDDYLLTTGLGGNVTFRHKDGSFTLDKGKLHEYQGQGVYALYDKEMRLVQDNWWLGYRTETGGLRTLARSGMNVYYQPLYNYASGKPVFIEWRRINVDWSFQLDLGAGDAVPWFVTFLTKLMPRLEPLVTPWAVFSTLDALVIARADQVRYSTMPAWPPYAYGTNQTGTPVPVPIPNEWHWPNPNGLYPGVPRR